MPIIRKQLKPSDVYPDNIRYNSTTGTVQTLIGDEWVDSLEADPRNQTTLPPRVTSDPSCDAAESIKDAFKGQIDGILTAIDASQTAFTIAGIILALFSFGVFAIFITIAIALAHVMLDAGTATIEAALTTTVYHQFMCILNCHMEGDTGRLKEDSLGDIQSDIDDQIGGLGAIILKAMTGLAGEGGMNNLASLGTSTGDCSDCECTEACPTEWAIQDYPGDIFGELLNDETYQTDGFLDVQTTNINVDSQYYVIINTPDKDQCCLQWKITTVEGGSLTLLMRVCGVDYSPFDYASYSSGSCLWGMLIKSPAPFRIKLYMKPCPEE